MTFTFMNKRKVWYGISLVLLIIGLVSYGLQGLNKGIDFTSGNVLQIQFGKEVTTPQIEEVLDEQGLAGYSVQAAGNVSEYVIRTKELTEAQNKELLSAFEEKYGPLDIKQNQKIGEVIGRELTRKAILALAISAVLMIIYISFRFEATFGVTAVAALLHDVLVTVGIFSLFQIEIDSSFVAAVLTIIGYSINNTIVTFDRIRENLSFAKKEALSVIVDKSINQTLVRTINMSLTVIFPLVALLVFGGNTTKVLSLALLIGVIVGTYSSTCIATSLWFDLRNKLDEGKKFKHANAR